MKIDLYRTPNEYGHTLLHDSQSFVQYQPNYKFNLSFNKPKPKETKIGTHKFIYAN